MEILWIEDKPTKFQNDRFDKTDLFTTNINNLHIPENFSDSLKEIDVAKQKYDLVVFDINLEEFINKFEDDKIEQLSHQFNLTTSDFIQRAGFYLYLRLIRHGFKDNRIVFLTGHASIAYRIKQSLSNLKESEENREFDRFIKILEKINTMISEEDSFQFNKQIKLFQEKNNFQIIEDFLNKLIQDLKQNPNGGQNSDLYDVFEESFRKALLPVAQSIHKSDTLSFHSWLKKKMTKLNPDFAYITLRRGLKKACILLKEKLENEGYDWIIFNKTTEANLDKKYLKDYLAKIENFLPLNPPEDKKTLYYQFLKEISAEWEMSRGYFDTKNNTISFKKYSIEYNFKESCQKQMKLLRNWTSHNQLTNELNEKELAFFFMTAMRGLFNLGVDEIYNYEEMMCLLFDNQKILKSEQIKKLLSKSYSNLQIKMYEIYLYTDGIKFHDLIEFIGKKIKKKQPDIKRQIKNELSKKLFYQNFWHGLFPVRLDKCSVISKEDSVDLTIKFDDKKLDQISFPYFLGKLIYKESF